MKTSARNQFTGTVSAVRLGSINDEVELKVNAGVFIVATVTTESRSKLGLQVGAKAFALVKASSIVVVVEAEGARLSARNQLAGTVAKVTKGAVNAEVRIELPDGEIIAAVITNDSVKTLGLTKGSPATAVFKASSVIVGVSD